ncbi:helix-turn-helix domain-containing protein [Novosphingobium kunmingense]|uniref:helix-turn-helix domain-containing protein n=1 Tax=Novosphingobium kunmingense TaxID=1211806 RepID=UPI000C2CA1D6|nr:helix-turn-helix domain-containing protein [Novosphingobium kunmingense]
MGEDILPPRSGLPRADADAVLQAVSIAFSLPEAELRGKGRRKRVVQARCMASWLLRFRLPRSGKQRSFPSLGRMLGGTDHGTVIYRVNKAEALAERDPAYAAKLRELAWLDPILPEAMPVTRLSAEDLARIDCQTQAAMVQAARCRHREAVNDAVARSRTKRGERVIEDDTDARNRASGSLLLAKAMLRARVAV